MKRIFIITTAFIFITGCSNSNHKFDASGTFEVDETVVSSEVPGKILWLNVNEGDSIAKGTVIGQVDSTNLNLQKEQVQATIHSLSEKTADVNPGVKLLQNQLAVQQSQLENLEHEKNRFENLLKDDAATGKQVDDLNAQIAVTKKQIAVTQQQINVQKNTIATQNRSIMSEKQPLEKQVAQINNQLAKADIINPVSGMVITKYAEPGEITSVGKALYDIADMSEMTLRAYITGTQFSQVKLNQPVKVYIDNGADSYKEMNGVITWISDKAEFTPKTIQTKDERANLVYAIKIKVKNDGYIKIGMYGEVVLNPKS